MASRLYRAVPGPTHMSVVGSNLLPWGYYQGSLIIPIGALLALWQTWPIRSGAMGVIHQTS